jgi:hypothetical protein
MATITNAAEAVPDVIPHRFLRIVFASTRLATGRIMVMLPNVLIRPGRATFDTLRSRMKSLDLITREKQADGQPNVQEFESRPFRRAGP